MNTRNIFDNIKPPTPLTINRTIAKSIKKYSLFITENNAIITTTFVVIVLRPTILSAKVGPNKTL